MRSTSGIQSSVTLAQTDFCLACFSSVNVSHTLSTLITFFTHDCVSVHSFVFFPSFMFSLFDMSHLVLFFNTSYTVHLNAVFSTAHIFSSRCNAMNWKSSCVFECVVFFILPVLFSSLVCCFVSALFVFVWETIRTSAMRVIHITVKTKETQKLRIMFVLCCSTCQIQTKLPFHLSTDRQIWQRVDISTLGLKT